MELTLQHNVEIAKLLAGVCPDCNGGMTPATPAAIESYLDDTGGEVIGLTCDSCYVHFMAGGGWDLSDFERYSPELASTPEKRAYITLLDERNDKCREQQWHWHNGRQTREACYAAQAEIHAAYQPMLVNDPFKLALIKQ